MGCNTRMVNARAKRIVIQRPRPAVTVQPKEARTTAMIAAYLRAIQRNSPVPAVEIVLEAI